MVVGVDPNWYFERWTDYNEHGVNNFWEDVTFTIQIEKNFEIFTKVQKGRNYEEIMTKTLITLFIFLSIYCYSQLLDCLTKRN